MGAGAGGGSCPRWRGVGEVEAASWGRGGEVGVAREVAVGEFFCWEGREKYWLVAVVLAGARGGWWRWLLEGGGVGGWWCL